MCRNFNTPVTAGDPGSRRWYHCLAVFHPRLPHPETHRNFSAPPRLCRQPDPPTPGQRGSEPSRAAPPPTPAPPKPAASTSSPRPAPAAETPGRLFTWSVFEPDREFTRSQYCRSSQRAPGATGQVRPPPTSGMRGWPCSAGPAAEDARQEGEVGSDTLSRPNPEAAAPDDAPAGRDAAPPARQPGAGLPPPHAKGSRRAPPSRLPPLAAA